MNCPSCKNPMQDDSVECEWCGNKIIPDFQPVYPKFGKNKYWFINKSSRYFVYLILIIVSIILSINGIIVFGFAFCGILFYEIFNYFKKVNN